MPAPAPSLPDALRDLKRYLDGLVARYEQPAFIDHDPIGIPHGFDDPKDQAVIGLYAALLAWGRRSTVINKLEELSARMDYRPHRFVWTFDAERDAAALDGFVHRTFQPTDAFWFTHNLHRALRTHGSIEALFADHLSPDAPHVGPAIQGFSTTLLNADPRTPQRLRKHLARPAAKSACKRINMYLRWMVRPGPVDFGLWTRITPDQLLLPVDVHAGRQARALGLLDRKSNDWKAVQRLTDICRRMAPHDPARYDFAFFGIGAHDDALDPRFTGENRFDRSVLPTA
ncbi:TIGR02757 family protein [Salisaeta longa]|uniref:TIGR02757 family protein n=1 Tax=Salisaeta longa TaxID=503170 RepID=UPI0003B3B480|nr:TIGR02757 family protein [Salisaeta longa]